MKYKGDTIVLGIPHNMKTGLTNDRLATKEIL